PNLYVTGLLAPLVPARGQLLAPAPAVALSDGFVNGNFAELGSYLGVPLLVVLVVVAVGRWREPRVRFLVQMMVTLLVLSMGPLLHVAGKSTSLALPWVLPQLTPVVQNILPGRLMLVTDLFAGLMLGMRGSRAVGQR